MENLEFLLQHGITKAELKYRQISTVESNRTPKQNINRANR